MLVNELVESMNPEQTMVIVVETSEGEIIRFPRRYPHQISDFAPGEILSEAAVDSIEIVYYIIRGGEEDGTNGEITPIKPYLLVKAYV